MASDATNGAFFKISDGRSHRVGRHLRSSAVITLDTMTRRPRLLFSLVIFSVMATHAWATGSQSQAVRNWYIPDYFMEAKITRN